MCYPRALKTIAAPTEEAIAEEAIAEAAASTEEATAKATTAAASTESGYQQHEVSSETTASTEEAAAPEAEATEATLHATKLRNIDLFQILIGQINKINELLGELLTIGRFHKSFPFLCETCLHLFACLQVPCTIFCDWTSIKSLTREVCDAKQSSHSHPCTHCSEKRQKLHKMLLVALLSRDVRAGCTRADEHKCGWADCPASLYFFYGQSRNA